MTCRWELSGIFRGLLYSGSPFFFWVSFGRLVSICLVPFILLVLFLPGGIRVQVSWLLG